MGSAPVFRRIVIRAACRGGRDGSRAPALLRTLRRRGDARRTDAPNRTVERRGEPVGELHPLYVDGEELVARGDAVAVSLDGERGEVLGAVVDLAERREHPGRPPVRIASAHLRPV